MDFFSGLPILTKTTKDCPQFLISKIFLKLFFFFFFNVKTLNLTWILRTK